MKRAITLLTVASLAVLPGCESVSQSETQGVFSGANAAAAAGRMAQAAGSNSAGSFATGSGTGAMAVATVTIIAKHQASVRQRQVAEQRARAAKAKLVAQQRAADAAYEKAASKASAEGKPAPKRVVKKVPRYIAVETVKEATTSTKAEAAVMLWDTQSEQIVGNDVYDIDTAPSVGQTAQFETITAEYVGG